MLLCFVQGAVADVAPGDTAFYYRSALFESQYFYFWTQGDEEGEVAEMKEVE